MHLQSPWIDKVTRRRGRLLTGESHERPHPEASGDTANAANRISLEQCALRPLCLACFSHSRQEGWGFDLATVPPHSYRLQEAPEPLHLSSPHVQEVGTWISSARSRNHGLPPSPARPCHRRNTGHRGGLPTCHRAVALESQHVVLAGTGAHQVEAALAAGRGEVADILGGGADRSPAVRVGIITLYLHCIQGGACERMS